MMSADEVITKPIVLSSVVSDAGNPTGKLEAPSPPEPDTPKNAYWEQLVRYNSTLGKDELLYPEFFSLQRLNILHLHNTLAEIKASTWQKKTSSKEQMAELKIAMHDYVTAIRNTEYINSLTRINPRDSINHRIALEHGFPSIASLTGAPFDTTYLSLNHPKVIPRDPIREFLRKHLYKRLSWSATEISSRRLEFYKNGTPETYSPFVDWLARFIIAIGGGASLIVPMLIMSIHSSQLKSLVTVSGAVVLFALCVSLVFQAENRETLTATATYAAVLVVFVGTSGAGA